MATTTTSATTATTSTAAAIVEASTTTPTTADQNVRVLDEFDMDEFFEDQTSAGAWHRFMTIDVAGYPTPLVMDIYKRWAQTFERDSFFCDTEKVGAVTIAERIVELCGNNKDANILDLCAGTGLVGAELYEMGYKNLDALDGCQAMLELAKEKKVHKKIIQHVLDDKRIPIEDNTYDGIVCSDSFFPGHIEDGSCFPELARITKPGGRILFRIEVRQLHRYEAALKKMEADGIWKYEPKETCLYVKSVDATWPYSNAEITVL